MIALYCRLSVADGEGGDESCSIANQRAILLDFVAAQDDLKGQDHRFFVDDGYSGTHAETRPALQEMLGLCREGEVSTVVVKDLSRLSRDAYFCVDLVEDRLPSLGVRLIAVSDRYDSRSARNDARAGTELAFKGIMNAFYSADLSRKVNATIRHKHAQGVNLSTVPFGYLKDDAGACAPDPVSSRWVQLIFELAAEGRDQREIARELNLRGIPTPGAYRGRQGPGGKKPAGAWRGTMVKGVVRNPHYKGTLVLGKRKRVEMGSRLCRVTDEEERHSFEGAHEAVVDAETWQRAQRSMTESGLGGSMEPVGHLFQGKVHCPHCGCAASYRRDSKVRPRYTCYCHCTPGAPSVSLAGLKDAVATVIDRHLDAVYSFKSAYEALGVDEAERKRLEAAIAATSARRIGLYESYRRGDMTARSFRGAQTELAREAEAMRARLDAADALLGELAGDDERLRARARDALRLAERFGRRVALDRSAVEAFVDDVLILDDDSVEVRLSYADIFG